MTDPSAGDRHPGAMVARRRRPASAIPSTEPTIVEPQPAPPADYDPWLDDTDDTEGKWPSLPAVVPTSPVVSTSPSPNAVTHRNQTSTSPSATRPASDPTRTTPPERFDAQDPERFGAWKFSGLGSACPLDGFDAGSRLDPYWSGLWASGSSVAWTTAALARRQATLAGARLPASHDRDPELAADAVRRSPAWTNRVALLGALYSWRTFTSEQAAALVGHRGIARATSRPVSNMFATGLVDLGVYRSGSFQTSLRSPHTVYRPSKSSAFDEVVLPHLTWPEFVSITGGHQWKSTGDFDRHNILATELGLRLAEFADIGAILGERFSTTDLLAGSGAGFPRIENDKHTADLTVIRPDGMRIAIEMTASTSHLFQKKVNRWARLLAERPLDLCGLNVVFVVAEHPERMDDDFRSRVRTSVYNAVAAACRDYPGSVTDRVAARIGVATWREWFPAPGLVNDAFLSLRVDRPTGSGHDLWETADFLDRAQVPFRPADPHAARAVIANSRLLGGTPFWMREGGKPELWPHLLDDIGLQEPPTPVSRRPDMPLKGRRLGAGVGGAQDTRPPRRLLGL